MKKEGSLKSILAILVIILLCLVSVGGIYVKDKNIMKNILPEYNLGMDLDTNTIIKLSVVKDEESSSQETNEENAEEGNNTESKQDNNQDNNQDNTTEENIYTADNYKKSKAIIEKRLKQSGINQYTIRLNENDGVIVLEVPNDSDTRILQNLFVKGKTEIKVSETGEVVGDYKSFSKIDASIDDSYKSYGIGSCIKLDITFSKDAVKKFKEMKDAYVIPTDEEGNQKENNVQIVIDGSPICSLAESEFLNSAVQGTLPLKLGEYSTDQKVLDESLKEAKSIKDIMVNGDLPITYTIDYSNEIHSNITAEGIAIVFAIILVAMFVYLIYKYKLAGLLAELTILGFGSLLLLVLRYTNVEISIASLVSIGGMLALQFVYLNKLLSNIKTSSKVFNENIIDFSKMIIPVFIISVIIAFANITEISGFGMVIFWGLIIFEIYNNIITRAILTNVKK